MLLPNYGEIRCFHCFRPEQKSLDACAMVALTFSPGCTIAVLGAPITCSKHEGTGGEFYVGFNCQGAKRDGLSFIPASFQIIVKRDHARH